MVPRDRATCPACAGPTPAPVLCAECLEAFAVASATVVADDLDLWDAWSLLGDVGCRPAVSGR